MIKGKFLIILFMMLNSLVFSQEKLDDILKPNKSSPNIFSKEGFSKKDWFQKRSQKLNLLPPAIKLLSIEIVANSTGPITPRFIYKGTVDSAAIDLVADPDEFTAQINGASSSSVSPDDGGQFYVSQSGPDGTNLQQMLRNIDNVVSPMYEIRFGDDEVGLAYDRFLTGRIYKVPITGWDLNGTPDDPSDDIQMIVATFPADFADSTRWGIRNDIPSPWPLNLARQSDWIYLVYPENSYEDLQVKFENQEATGMPDLTVGEIVGAEVLARITINSLDDNPLTTINAANGLPRPKAGTIIRWTFQIIPGIDIDNLYGVVGAAYSVSPTITGFPQPTFSLISAPSGMTMDANSGTLNWTPGSGQEGFHDIVLEASNAAGTTQETFTIWVDAFPRMHLEHNNNNTVLSVFNSGKVGGRPDLSLGSGFQFNGMNGLFDGNVVIGQSESQVSGRLDALEDDSHFATGPMSPITQSPIPGFDQAFTSTFSDRRADNPIGITISQDSYSKSTPPDDDYVIMDYTIFNETTTDLSGIYFGVAIDWDVGSAGNNLAGFDSVRKLSYVFEADDADNPNYYGVRVLSGEVSGHTFNAQVDDGGDSLLFSWMITFEDTPTDTTDYRPMISVGPYEIPVGDGVRAVFAIVGGTDLADLQANADAAQAAFDQAGSDVNPPVITHSANSSISSGQSQTISATITDNVDVQSATLFYRRGGASSYSSSVMTNTSGAIWEGAILPNFVTERGVEYYFSTQDPTGNSTTFPATNPQDNPEIIQVTSSNLSFSSPNLAYRMISVPIDLDNSSPSSVFVDDLGTYDDTQWRLLRYINGNFDEFPNTGNLDPGRGFWFITRGSKSLGTGSGKSVTTEGNYVINLQTGWNQIGNPFAFTVNWSDVVKGTNVENRLVGYSGSSNDATGYDFMRTQLVPYQGYFVNNLGGTTTIEIPPKSSTGNSVVAKQSLGLSELFKLQNDEWALQLTAQSGRFLDKDNYIGVLNGASDEWDKNDFSEAPFFDSFVSLYFPHEDWDTYPGLYTGDFRSINTEGHYWDLHLKSNIPNSEIVLSLANVQNLPIEMEVVLIDKTSRISVNLIEQNAYTFIAGEEGTERDFRIVVGQTDFINSNDLGFSGIPEAFTLSQNYPNPFNPETRINYELPTTSLVKIVVFNLRGQLVRTLLDAKQSAGRYTVSWDGTTDQGIPMASGVYLLRMTAGEFLNVRKMLLTK